MSRESEILNAGRVKRWHTEPNIPVQSNAEHSWGVAILLLLTDPDVSRELLIAALIHDLPEKDMGDIPSPFKKVIADSGLSNILKEYEANWLSSHGFSAIHDLLVPIEAKKLKDADQLEALIYLQNVSDKSASDRIIERLLQIRREK